MPWRGPERPGEFPTLGWSVGEWIEAHCVIPDGDDIGQPYLLTDEMWTFLAWHYRLRADATEEGWRSAWHFRRSQLVRPQKWGKGPLTCAMVCAEAAGPVRFAGWDAGGEPVGRPWETPWIQIAATSEDQTDNVYRALVPMIDEGPLADLIPDTGETRINVPGGGRVEPVTSSGRARLGQRITFAVQDETHSWLDGNGGWRLAETQRRNLSGTGGRAVETTNAWDPSEQSVAQRTAEASVKDVHRDHRVPPPASLANKRERHKALRLAYGDSAVSAGGWVDLDRIDGELVEIAEKDPAQAERFYMNRIVAGTAAFIERDHWAARLALEDVPDGTRITLGFDGSDVDDWTGIRAETLDGYQFTPTYGPDQRPTVWNPAEWDGQAPRLEVDAAVEELMGRFDVVRMYCDPPYWDSEVDGWSAKYGDRVVVDWYTNRVRQMHEACQRLVTDVTKRDSTWRHDGCEWSAQHVANARKAARPAARYVLRKASPTQKIDLAVCSVLAHEAAMDATAAGLTKKRKRRVVGF
ncbi:MULTISPECIES: hypothetical protein [unclassified Streptomyces]|uniref:hypothetical protein n=1 Tax=unclassified Streptomyces TaxID=2593676 RepID=UPI00081E70D7|nr:MULTISPECIES: hypothetical protein [unclassified Streptomyces]MYR29797.1 hypothetical protein [Streptomyces sp. SID4945]SCF47692.1 hypothetical protein GA0115257_11916 [Streptomyces sp. LcepLS]